MSFKSYLIEKFSTTHENKYFRKFAELLNSKFSDTKGEHVLVGNISCNGHQMDAIFIAHGQITVIDFKDYSGALTFSENNPWRLLTPEGSLVFVQGGAQCRNPFQQVKAYRFALAEILENNQSEIFHGIRDNINWMHIGCVVLFHRAVSYEQSEIPIKTTRFFHISDTKRIAGLLGDLHSRQMELDDREIKAILNLLDIREDNLFEQSSSEEETSPPQNLLDGRNLSIIKKVTGNLEKNESSYLRELSFYKTLISTERVKEPSVEKLFPFPFDKEASNNNYPFDLTTNNELHQLFLENQQQRFPKNLFIGLDVKVDGKFITALCDIVPTTDTSPDGTYQANLNNFELCRTSFENAGLAEDAIEELSQATAEKNTLQDKLKFIGKFFDNSHLCVSRVSLGLSQESMVSAQLFSELNKLRSIGEAEASSLLKSFLSMHPVQTEEKPLLLHPFVEISKLNKSQKKAIELSFKQPLTVITGPPGTGKSQVVMNIIANAVVSGRSVLFASKNNKAVDTVKERLDAITNEPYLIRFGSRDQIETSAIPEIKKQIARAGFGKENDQSFALKASIDELTVSNKRLKYLREQIALIPHTRTALNKLNKEMEREKDKFEKWESDLNPDYKRLFIERKLSLEIDINDINLLLQQIKKWNSGMMSRLLFRLLKKSILEQSLRTINQGLDKETKEFVSDISPWASSESNLLTSGMKNLTLLVDLISTERNIREHRNAFLEAMATLECREKDLSEKLRQLENSKNENQAEILLLEDKIIEQGSKVLNQTITQKLHEQDIINTQCYIDCLPANQIWKEKDVAYFTNAYKYFLKSYSAVCLTSLAVKNSAPLTPPLVDLLVIDEASQCDIASAIPLIARANRVVVIGDPLQLRHITRVREYEQEYLIQELGLSNLQLDYVDTSLFDHCFKMANKSNLESVFLDEHYRCHPKIIGFSNRYFYEKRLGQTITIRTAAEQFISGKTGLNWINVKGTVEENRNINLAEIKQCIDLATRLSEEFPDASIGVVTPFRDQYKKLFSSIPEQLRKRVKVDTVHKYQGDEKDIIIFSLVVATGSPATKVRFLDKNEYLINVAITRARSTLYIIGDLDYCKNLKNGATPSPLSQLARYADGLTE